MLHISRRIKIFIAFLVIVVGGYFWGRMGLTSQRVPASFTDARLQAAIIAQDIVGASNQIAEKIGEVANLDKARETKEALDKTLELLEKSAEVKGKATELSKELEKMTAALPEIKSEEARAAALEAISDHLALISRLISYSDYLANLLTSLRNRFEGLEANPQIGGLITQINAEVTAINNFNRQATEALEKFDQAVKAE